MVLSQVGARLPLPRLVYFNFFFCLSKAEKIRAVDIKSLTGKEVGLMLAHIGGMSTVLAATSF